MAALPEFVHRHEGAAPVGSACLTGVRGGPRGGGDGKTLGVRASGPATGPGGSGEQPCATPRTPRTVAAAVRSNGSHGWPSPTIIIKNRIIGNTALHWALGGGGILADGT